MYVRLAFAVAAHLEPEILVIDEVLAVGDAEFQKKCLGKMGEISQRAGRTVLFVSHQLGMVGRLCSRAVLLDHGTLAFSGSSSATLDKYVALGSRGTGSTVTDFRKDRFEAGISRIQLLGPHEMATEQFSWHEHIHVRIDVVTKRQPGGMLLGVAMDNRHGMRVTTWVTRVADHVGEGIQPSSVDLKISPKIIAPGGYSLTAALFEPGIVYHQLENQCPFTIVDSGSEMAAFSNVDYGVTIIPARWSSPGNVFANSCRHVG
jgi:lipopolysaccharide transport system ATP-binding protein